MMVTRARIPLIMLTLAAAFLLGALPAAARGKVHLRVEATDARTGEATLRLNMPLDSVDALLEVLEDEIHADLDLRGHEDHFLSMRKIYLAVRDEDLSDFLEMQDDDGTWVKVWKDREAFRVEARDREGDETANLYLPLSVLDALFGGGDEPDLHAALKELRSLAPLTILSVDDERRQVRVWLE